MQYFERGGSNLETSYKIPGYWSSLGTYGLLALIALATGALWQVGLGILALLMGKVGQIPYESVALSVLLPAIAAAVVLELPVSICSGLLVERHLGSPQGKHGVSTFFRTMVEGNHFFDLFLLVLAEELFARGIFLGLLPHIPILSGTGAFYLLFLLRNGL